MMDKSQSEQVEDKVNPPSTHPFAALALNFKNIDITDPRCFNDDGTFDMRNVFCCKGGVFNPHVDPISFETYIGNTTHPTSDSEKEKGKTLKRHDTTDFPEAPLSKKMHQAPVKGPEVITLTDTEQESSHPKQRSAQTFHHHASLGIAPKDFSAQGGLVDVSTLLKSAKPNKIAIDCEFVGVGYRGEGDALGRVSIVTYEKKVLYDKYVRVEEEVVDYRTFVSGIEPKHLLMGDSFCNVQREVRNILRNRILIGHQLNSDLRVLRLPHPSANIRDTTKFSEFKRLFPTSEKASLKKLCKKVLGLDVQKKSHDSINDAKLAMELYKVAESRFDKEFNAGREHAEAARAPKPQPRIERDIF
uniref:RNA exonuclease 4 n=1 Tax=Rhabditophanes sp. KR3021 TaxID=114890 RepID=A0AC35UEQ6_9BILA